MIRRLIAIGLLLFVMTAYLDAFGNPFIPGLRTPITYYFSTGGSDSNNCQSEATACQTMAKAATITYHDDDRLLFKGGDSFTGCMVLSGAKVRTSSLSRPLTIGKYGSGYPILSASCSSSARVGVIELRSVIGVVVQDLIFRGNGGGAAVAVLVTNPSPSQAGHIIIRRNDVSGLYNYSTTHYGAHIFVDTCAGKGGYDNIQILDNILHGATPTSPDNSGISSNACGKLIRNVLYRGNHVYNLGGSAARMTGNGDGVLANGVVGGLLEYNLVHDIGGNHNKCGGPVGIWAHNADNVIIQFNEVFRVRPVPSHPGTGCDWNGIGLDAGGGSITNSIVQYNYSHHNGGSGFYHWGAPGSGKNVFRYNIAEENNTNNSNNFGAMSFNGVGITGRVDVYNNTFSQPASPTGNATGVIAWQAYNIRPESGIVANNIIITSKDRFGNAVFMNGGLSDIRQTFANNLYYAPSGAFNIRSWSINNANYTSYASWQAVTGETGGLVTNPLLSGTGGSDTCGGGSLACPKQYTLQAGSPAIGAGSNLPSVYGITEGGRDFFGAMVPVSSRSGYNIGATGVPQTYPYIDLSAATLRSNATQGVSIGTLSVFNGNGLYTFTVTNSAMSRVEVSGNVLRAGSVSSVNSEMPVLLISIQATNGADTLSRYFVVMVAP